MKDKRAFDIQFAILRRVGRATPPSAKHPNGLPPQIILKFTSYAARRKVMKARKSLKDLKDRPCRIYINEDLTRKRAQIATAARSAKDAKKILDTWVFDGKIFLKLMDETVSVVTTMAKLLDIID